MKGNLHYNIMNNISPPIQPVIDARVLNYQETLFDWNIQSAKKGALFYQFKTNGERKCLVDLLPDACINILFKCDKDDPDMLISGVLKEKRTVEFQPNTVYFGFKPYSLNGMINKKNSIKELNGQTISIGKFFPNTEEITEKIVLSGSFQERIQLFLDYTEKNIIDTDYTPDLTEYLAILICNSMGHKPIKKIVEQTGYSDRYCRQKFQDTYGISLKDYSNIIRFQNTLKALVNKEDKTMTEIAYANGYFDQAHFINDFKKFTNNSPTQFIEHLHQGKNKIGKNNIIKCG